VSLNYSHDGIPSHNSPFTMIVIRQWTHSLIVFVLMPEIYVEHFDVAVTWVIITI
jgi:hypothetical protein